MTITKSKETTIDEKQIDTEQTSSHKPDGKCFPLFTFQYKIKINIMIQWS